VSFLPKHAQDTFSGDLVCPADFKWVFEVKCGYNEIDLNAAFDGGVTDLDAFLAAVRGRECQDWPKADAVLEERQEAVAGLPAHRQPSGGVHGGLHDEVPPVDGGGTGQD
jgi:hypothetical protein